MSLYPELPVNEDLDTHARLAEQPDSLLPIPMATTQDNEETNKCNTTMKASAEPHVCSTISEDGDILSPPQREQKKSLCTCSHETSPHPQPSRWHTAATKSVAGRHMIRRDSTTWNLDDILDPYKTFEVQHSLCMDLEVTVHNGENITKGNKFKDAFDTPDPYIVLRIPQIKINTPKRTTTEDNSINPTWNQTFHFYLTENPSKPYIMEISLMDENLVIDEAIDKQLFPLGDLEEGKPEKKTFTFKGNSKVHMTFLKQQNKKPDLRFSMALCDEEKDFRRKRRKICFESMKAQLGDGGPLNETEVPTIGILGSGGGYRAMIAFSGVLRALQESGLLDSATYIGGLSGSTWCMSTLYCQEPSTDSINGQENDKECNKTNMEERRFSKEENNKNYDIESVTKPTDEMKLKSIHIPSGCLDVKEFQTNLCESVGKNMEWNILKMPQYGMSMFSKYWTGHSMKPGLFVDIFGHVIGDVLLGKEKKKLLKLSDLKRRIIEGKAPFPLFAGLHANDKSSTEFSEWIEFSPYEIGMGKYGTFMKTEDFGSQFFAGKLVKKFDESPLHYLQGIWGSAFTVNLKKHLIGAESSETEDTDEYTDNELLNAPDVESDDSEDEIEDSTGKRSSLHMRLDTSRSFKKNHEECIELKVTVQRGENISKGNKIKDAIDTPDPYIVLRIPQILPNTKKRTKACDNEINPRWDQTFHFYLDKNPSTPYVMDISLMDENVIMDDLIGTQSFKLDCLDEGLSTDHTFTFKRDSKVYMTFLKQKAYRKVIVDESKKESWFVSSMKAVNIDNLLNTRAVKPGSIHNPFRGLSLKYSFAKDKSVPDHQRDEIDSSEVCAKYADGCKFKPLKKESKKISVMDSGFAFNSPYPLLLRPQRGVDLFLSFDFSARQEDLLVDKETFSGLIKAEKWANEMHMPFPPVMQKVDEYLGTDIQECYLFESSSEEHVPVILHFPLVNNKFRNYKTPGVERSSEEEKEFSNFTCFGKDSDFSTFKFHYDSKGFERLSKLMEFNTLLHVDTIKNTLKDAIINKRNRKPLNILAVTKLLVESLENEI